MILVLMWEFIFHQSIKSICFMHLKLRLKFSSTRHSHVIHDSMLKSFQKSRTCLLFSCFTFYIPRYSSLFKYTYIHVCFVVFFQLPDSLSLSVVPCQIGIVFLIGRYVSSIYCFCWHIHCGYMCIEMCMLCILFTEYNTVDIRVLLSLMAPAR